MNALGLLLAITTSVLMLRSGETIPVDGEVRQENGVVVFRSAGVLYSLPATEIERIAPATELREAAPPRDGANEAPVRPLRLSEEDRRRLIAELEKNRAGTPAPRQRILEEPPPTPTRQEIAAAADEEWAWRRRARAHEESLRRAQEELQLLERQVDDLQFRILTLISLGYKPHQFSYDTTLLMRTRERIPWARLEVERAERALAQFRDDARRQGILPGWLR